MDVPGLVDPTQDNHEIDILESYGNNIGILHSTDHFWSRDHPSDDWGIGAAYPACSMTTGFHTYGLDLQPDELNFYYDRQIIWTQNNTIPGGHGSYDRPMWVMVSRAPHPRPSSRTAAGSCCSLLTQSVCSCLCRSIWPRTEAAISAGHEQRQRCGAGFARRC